jgi:hypothetical protein
MAVNAELKRRNQNGDLVDWKLNSNGTDPVEDAVAAGLLEEIKAALVALHTIVWETSTPLLIWDYTHNLGRFPLVQAFDNTNVEMFPEDVVHVNADRIRLTWGGVMSGKMVLT